jgi:alkaline phosphatase D
LNKNKTSNPIVLSGDVHANFVSDLKLDFDDPSSITVGSEFVATSISSGGNGRNRRKLARKFIAKNPHIKFFDKRRGYLVCEVTQDIWKTDIRQVEFVEENGSPIKTSASFEVKNGVAGAAPI